jgi:hypothetical protein
VRSQSQQRPRFGENTLSIANIGRDTTRLEGDIAVVSPIDGPQDGALAPLPDDSEHLVPSMEQRG